MYGAIHIPLRKRKVSKFQRRHPSESGSRRIRPRIHISTNIIDPSRERELELVPEGCEKKRPLQEAIHWEEETCEEQRD